MFQLLRKTLDLVSLEEALCPSPYNFPEILTAVGFVPRDAWKCLVGSSEMNHLLFP